MRRNEKDEQDHRDELERALAEVLSEPLDDRRVEEAAARVWGRLSAAAGSNAGAAAPLAAAAVSSGSSASSGPQGCQDFGHQVPAYLRGELTSARALLLEDHTRDCLPCRRALHAARQERAGQAAVALHEVAGDGPRRGLARRRETPAAPATATRWRWLAARSPWLAAAAILLLGLGLGAAIFRAVGPAAGRGTRMARVEAVEGNLYRIEGATSVAVGAGAAVAEGERVRTAKGSRAVLRMTDGSRIEMAERAGLSLTAGRGGNTVELERGLIIVQAAHQRPRHLYVATADCLVSVTGTIFAVNHGTKGSRVSVVEGEVRVRRAAWQGSPAWAATAAPAPLTDAADTRIPAAHGSVSAAAPLGSQKPPETIVLHAGQQVTTHPSVAAVPVREEVAWSRDSARYDALLAELKAAGSDLDQQVTRQAPRTSSRLLELVPAGTLVYVALPNFATSLQQTQQLLEQRLAESPVLRQWWSETLGSPENEARFHDLVREVGDVGRYLGDEVVIAAGSAAASPNPGAAGSGAADPGLPVLLAEAAQEPELRATLQQEVAAINQRQGKTALVLLDQLPDPSRPSGPLLLWVGQGLLIASPSAAQIGAVAANLQAGAANPFAASSFHARLAQAYADGAGWLFGADLGRLMAQKRAGKQGTGQPPVATGLFDLEHFVIERHDAAAAAAGSGKQAAPAGSGDGLGTETRAALTFSQQRRGVAAWLAAPAPMGSLGFFSGDANLVAAFVVKSPVELLDELLSLSPELAAELTRAEAEHGFNLRDDLAAPLGGEIALGLDGPVLPSPSWELVAEVYDPVRLQQTLSRAVLQASAELVASGKPGMELREEQDGGRTYYTVTSTQPQLELHYLFADGYLVAAPARALLDRALAQRSAGTSLAGSSRLRGLLGRDGQVNVSALFYQNLGPVLAPLGSAAGAVAAAQGSGPAGARGALRPGFGSMLLGGGRGPSLLYAYAEADRIVFAGHGEAGPMGLNLETLAGFGGILGGMERAHDAAHPRRGGS
jgi:ferric-dicitrate binding protein FerR (iron transport regulator)